MKEIMVGVALMVGVVLMVATATPGFAQAYCGCWGTGNVLDQPLLEKTNGAYGYAMSVPSPDGAAAFAHASRHTKHNHRR